VSFYGAVRSLFLPAGRWYFRMEVEGIENVPRTGAVIVAANHVSWLDPAVLGSACPRPIRFLIARSVYGAPWARWFYAGMKAIPVENGDRDPRSLRAALRALARGEVVGVFPEGQGLDGTGGPRRPKPGATLLAALSGAPFVPVCLEGTLQAWPPGSRFPRPGRVRVRFGPSFRQWSGRARPDRAELDGLAQDLMTRINRLGGGAS
jgi:1-acyl-sn-glycerol-3-phosphate acyltransferase